MKKVVKKRIFIICTLWLSGYLIMIIGCGNFKGVLTTPIVYQLSDMASPKNEFLHQETPMHKNIFHEGVFVGIINRRGAQWRQYHFTMILNPTNRVLEVLVQDKADGKVFVREIGAMGSGKEKAFLIDNCFCGECIPKMEHKKHYLYTNALGSDNFICSPPERLNGNEYSGGFVTADISLRWIQRNRFRYGLVLCKLLYSIPFDFIIVPIQPYFYAPYLL